MSRSYSRTRYVRVGLIALIAWTCIEVLYIRLSQSRSLNRRGPAIQRQSDPEYLQEEDPVTKIFIASTHWNNEAILRSHWNDAVLNLVKHFGPANVYASVVESGSWDDSKGALRNLETRLTGLGARSTFVLDPMTHADEIRKTPGPTGWIATPRNNIELRRIPFLAGHRNKSLQPLFELAQQGETFDKVLFLNDVVFFLQDALELLQTRNGDYAAACALDFSKPPAYYDTFALRDIEGEKSIMDTWPFFRARTSRDALKSGQPVPVKSCWNGMVIMDAAAFHRPKTNLSFRGISDDLAALHLEASECCLIHVDNPISKEKGIYLNSRVRIGYNPAAYKKVHENNVWPDLQAVLVGLWKNRLIRVFTTSWFEKRTIANRLSQWVRAGTDRFEAGTHCLINEMQVLVDSGWAHV